MSDLEFHGTTILSVKKDGKTVLIGDGQVSLGNTVFKSTAKKVRRLYQNKVLVGFAGSTADAFALFDLFETKLEQNHGNLFKSAVDLAKEWRTSRVFRHLQAMLIVADKEASFVLSGSGDIIEPEDGIVAIGSGGLFALAAARALAKNTSLEAKEVAVKAMEIAAAICVFTNTQFVIEEVS